VALPLGEDKVSSKDPGNSTEGQLNGEDSHN
jgi:hypothetical protein